MSDDEDGEDGENDSIISSDNFAAEDEDSEAAFHDNGDQFIENMSDDDNEGEHREDEDDDGLETQDSV